MPQIETRPWSIGHDPLVTPLFLNLTRAHKVVHDHARVIWGRHDLTPAEFDVLFTLRNVDAPYELTPGQIQERVLITSGGLTKVIHLLEEKGFVERSVDQGDNRVKPVRLTASGGGCIAAVMRDLADKMGEWIRSILSKDEIQAASQALHKIAQ